MVEVRFTVPIADIPDEHKAEAERNAQEAFVLTLLRRGDISAGRTAEILGIDRWQLGDLMSLHGISPFDETLTREDLEREERGLDSRIHARSRLGRFESIADLRRDGGRRFQERQRRNRVDLVRCRIAGRPDCSDQPEDSLNSL